MHRPLILLLAICASAAVSSAETHLVKPDGTGDFPTIQAALDGCAAGDIIELTDGTFLGDGNRDLDFGGKALTLHSQSGDAELCVINCQGSAADPHRGFDFHSGEGAESIVHGITIIHGYAAGASPDGDGGGVRCTDGSSPRLRYCVVTECTAEGMGGGVSGENGSGPILECCRLVLNLSTLTGTGGGGGMALLGNCAGTLIGCELIENNAYYSGGGLGVWTGSSLTATNCTFANNQAGYAGGGVSCSQNALVDLQQCLIHDNQCNIGGGVLVANTSDLVLHECTIANNDGTWGGGMNLSSGSHADATNTTFYSNGGSAGNLIYLNSTGTMDNCIVAFGREGSAVTYAAPTLTCCDFYGNMGLGYVEPQMGTNGNIEEDPLFHDAENLNFHLEDESPCLPFTEPNPECDLIGACCAWSHVGSWTPRAAAAVLLFQPAPNPFDHQTRITYEIASGAEAAPVTLEIHDLTGRLVRSLVQRPQSAGFHHVVWDGRDSRGRRVADGIYFCHLRALGETHTRTLTALQ